MIEDSKVIFITHPYYAVNNPSNNLRLYMKAKNSNKWRYIQCKTKEEYKKRLNDYIAGFYEYSRDEEKTQISIKEMSKGKTNSLFDYFMDGKKQKKLWKKIK